MTIKSKIYTAGVITFLIFVVLASMNIWTHRQVLSNLQIRDDVNEKLDGIEKFVKWKNELIRSVSDIVGSGRVPPYTEEQFILPFENPPQEAMDLVMSGKKLVFLIDQKSIASRQVENIFNEYKLKINDLYYQLDKNIATVLAMAQLEQVLGEDTLEKSSLAPYVLKSLNQMTLVALNIIISRNYTEDERRVVTRNKQFLQSQLHTIDRDGSLNRLFEELFSLIESLDEYVIASKQTLDRFNLQISEAKNGFNKAVGGAEIESIVAKLQSEQQRANERLEKASRNSLIIVIFFLILVPVLVIGVGIFGLNTLIIGPITRFVDAMKYVERGNFDVTIPVTNNDEFGLLARNFNAMAVEIKAQVTEMHQLNRTLKESESKYRTLVDNLPQRIFLKNKDLFYVSCNGNFALDLGLSEEEIVGKIDFDFFPKYLAEKYRNDDARIIQTGNTEEIEESYIKDGQEIIIQTVKTPVKDDRGQIYGVLGIFWDITKRKRDEEELQLFRFSLENASVGTFWVDSEARIQYVNQKGCQNLGYARDELLGMSIPDIDPNFIPEYFAQSWRDMSDGTVYLAESTHCRKDGSTFPIEIFVRQAEFKGTRLNFAFINDITERRLAEQKMLESRQRHRSIIQTAMDGFWLTDYQGRILEVNEAYCSMSGYKENELLSMCISELEARETANEIEVRMNRVAEQGDARFETRHRRKDGKYFEVEVSVQYRPDDGGRYVHFLRDVTEKNKIENQLIQAQKMEALGTLAGGIAHDFNNLLQAINGYSQLLLYNVPEDDPRYENLRAIEQAGHSATELVKQLLLFSRKAEAARRPINLNLEIEQAARILERTIPKMIEIKFHPGEMLWSINADPVQMEQILLNLGKNAADAMPEGGALIIETENIILDNDHQLKNIHTQKGRYVLITFSDTGKGIDEETLEHIFEPFFTTKEIGKGTGLGLASVYGIVKSHGGYLTCYSLVGQGTTFRIYLPAAENEDDRPRKEITASRPQRGSETILIVDDDASLRKFASQALEMFGYGFMTANSGEEALEIYSAKSDEIDLIILDLGMPGMGGHKCLQELLRIDGRVKVLIASGYSLNDQVKDSIEAGAAGYVPKPYKVNELLEKVRSVLDNPDE